MSRDGTLFQPKVIARPPSDERRKRHGGCNLSLFGNARTGVLPLQSLHGPPHSRGRQHYGYLFRCDRYLYLAYDLLGGQHGPLRLLTRAVTYPVVFGIGYGIGLGLFFGLASGLATGLTLSIEFNRAARGLNHNSLFWEGPWFRKRTRGWRHTFSAANRAC